MHPVTTQAIASERIREFHAHAAAAERTRQLRSSRRAGRVWLFIGVLRSRPTSATRGCAAQGRPDPVTVRT
jgi:hypothetical protein